MVKERGMRGLSSHLFIINTIGNQEKVRQGLKGSHILAPKINGQYHPICGTQLLLILSFLLVTQIKMYTKLSYHMSID